MMMMMMKRASAAVLALLAAAWLLGGCAAPTIADYANESPRLDLREYFNGELVAQGLFSDRAGKVVKRFSVKIDARWQGDEGVLDEAFVYSDGSTQRRVWRLRRLPYAVETARYVVEADDVVGQAQGEAAGNALHWRYTLRLPVDGREIEVQFDDWMFLMDGGVMLNRAAMSKFGVHLGDVTLSFTRLR